MSSNDGPIGNPMTERNPSDHPGMSASGQKTLAEEAVLSFHNISYRETVQSGFPLCKMTHEIERLSNISGIMKPGLNAIMGPQDRSRSLLLDVLAARRDPRGLSGEILINGKPRPANFTCTSGYVPQNDVVMDTVTVRDNLEFSAALRLSMTTTRDEKRRHINEVLKLLKIDKVADRKPRSKELRKITGIAVELVADHPILFLDEPITGLGWRTATDVISVLRRMSKKGRTIIFSIRQPVNSIFRLFDSLTLVASGKVMFHGPAKSALEYFESAGYIYDLHKDPLDVFLDFIIRGAINNTKEDSHEADEHEEFLETEHQVTEKLARMYIQSSFFSETSMELDRVLGEQQVEMSSALEVSCVTPFCHQLVWIIRHSFKNAKGFLRVTMTKALITDFLAAAVGIIFWIIIKNDCIEIETRAGLLYLLTGFQCITSISAGRLFVTDRDRFLHEHTSGYYRVLPYFLGKLLAELGPRRLLRTVLITPITFGIAGLISSVKGFFAIMLTVMLLTYSASSLSLSVHTGEKASPVRTRLVTIYFVFMMFFSGLSLCFGSLLPALLWIQYFNIPHYGFQALLHNEFLGQTFCLEHNGEELSRCQDQVICSGEEFLTMQGIELSSWGFWKNHVALASIMSILFTCTYVRLHHKKLEVLRSWVRKFLQFFK
ncbi:ATP-binding cassette sub-family G member 3-like [Psammomys obesus]|uniref:ATP-binding cassette sub-family G member 3-like n=1 Tax=Psammomys obesus TaxID=48139 RepID=UPI0024534BFC|nr:ATP-binding cassette sub-family G member 3-like [Psammomys obesus]